MQNKCGNALFDLSGKKAFVTGATRGLGLAMAEGLMEAGAETVIFGTTEKVYKVAEEFTARGFQCQGLVVDLGNREDRTQKFAEGLQKLGQIDILVNAAGIQRRHPSEEFPIEDWDEVLEVNLTAVFHWCQLAGREMLKKKCGKIINIASIITWHGGFTIPAYAASKGGVAQITKAFGNEWASKGINVNALAPGYMATDMNEALLDENNPRFRQITERIPALRWGEGEDMKGPCVFLASEASNYLSGAVIPVDGGYLVR